MFESLLSIEREMDAKRHPFLIGGEDGIRTHGTLRYTAFRVRLVMTTSILLQLLKGLDLLLFVQQ